jgi:hypothetical protein
MRYSSRFFLYAPFALFVCLAIAVVALWWREAGAWTRKIDALNNHEIMPGVILHFGSRQIAGFPFRVDTIFKDFRISVAGPHAFQWQAEEFALHRLTYADVKTVFEAGGRQTLSWKADSGKAQAFVFLPGSIRADALINAGKLSRFDLVLVALASEKLTAGRVEIHLRHDPALDAIDLVAFGENLSTPSHKPILYAKIDSRITVAQSLKGLLSGDAEWRAAAEAWRNAEGRIELVDVQSKDGTATIEAKTDVMLDAQHRLTGKLSKEIFGLSQIATGPLY